MPLGQVKRLYPEWRVLLPTRLPPGYSLQCVIPYSPILLIMVYWNRGPLDPPTPHEHHYVEGWPWDGAIVIYITWNPDINGTQAILEIHEGFRKGRPDRKSYLFDVNGVLAWGKEPCADCGIMTDYMTNGTVYTKRFPTLGRLDFFRDGLGYVIYANMSLSEIVEIARSMVRYW